MARRLYKYLPSQFAESFVTRGELMFRSLSYFHTAEGLARGDALEGTHVDHPDNDITIENLSTGAVIKGDFAFLNRINTDAVFCFCMSTTFTQKMLTEFDCDACVEITNVADFLSRWRVGLKAICPHWHFMMRRVTYYDTNKPTGIDIKNPRNLAFFKPSNYQHQAEYRLIAAPSYAFALKEQIVVGTKLTEVLAQEHRNPETITVACGSLADITIVHHT